MKDARAHARAQRDAILTRLQSFLSIPSISTQQEHREDVARAADWLAQRLREIGLTVRVDPTPGHPIVYGEHVHDPRRPTVLIYGHYDVQPVAPLEEWHDPPFEPSVRDGKILARGAADDKGQLLAQVEALAAWQATDGLPTNVKVVFEGEEEVGSRHLAPWLEAHASELDADVALISDSAMIARNTPSIVYGLRGLTYLEVRVQGPNQDLHSGLVGGAVRNPANALAHILAGLQDLDGRVQIPGFYDRVRPLSDEERSELARVPFNLDALRSSAGDAGGWGEPGYSLQERIRARPTLDINGLVSGWTGEGAKTVLPATATAKVSMRLVPDQDPEEIAALTSAYIEQLAPDEVRVDITSLHGAAPAICPRDIPAMTAAARAFEAGFGRAPVFTREGGSIPVVAHFQSLLDLPTVMMGFGLPDDNLHAPNEKFELDQLWSGIDTAIVFHHQLASLVDAGSPAASESPAG